MKPVGFLGITKRTTQIILKNFKHFLCIAILWVIPYAFHVPVLDPSSFALNILVGSCFSLYNLIAYKEQFPSADAALPPNNAEVPFPKLHLPSLSPIIIGFFFCITIPLVSHPLLTFSVCRACLNKSLSLKGSFLGVSRSAKNLALTSLCMGMLAFGFIAMTLGMMVIIVGVVATMGGNDLATEYAMAGLCTIIGVGTGGLYLAISFSLAHTVAILEEKRGWGAMRRSMDLVNGRKWVALGLACLFCGMYELCTFGVLWRWRGASIVRVSLQALIALCSMAAQVVLYVSCREHEDPPASHTLMAASAHFGPQQSAPKSMDLETAAFLLP